MTSSPPVPPVRVRARVGARIVASVAVALSVLVPSPAASATFTDVLAADAALDLEGARRLALEIVADDPTSADAVAAAAWWADMLELLPGADAILAASEAPRDPALELHLGRIASRLEDAPPPGSLAEVEVAGPFGVFDALDLERGVVPADDGLPPLPTPYSDHATPSRLRIRSADGFVGPPETMLRSGVFLAAWTLELERPFDGWLAVECRGGFNLELDGRPVERRRQCGEVDPEVSWYRVRLEAGRHRLRAELASRRVPRIRATLIDADGVALAPVAPSFHGPARWAPSQATPSLPPAEAGLGAPAGAGAAAPEAALLAAALADGRGDPILARRWYELALAGGGPVAALRHAWFLLLDAPDLATEDAARRAGELLAAARPLPAAGLLERAVALRERRLEDAERVLAELAEDHLHDPRVRQLWTGEGIRRGWAREIEDGLAALTAALPDSQSMLDLRLDALEALDRWDDRRRLLLAAVEDRFDAGRVDELSAACQATAAIAAVERQRDRADDPALDLGLARLLLESGRTAESLAVLDDAVARWGPLPALDELRLVATAGDAEAFDAALDAGLERSPSDVRLRALAWRQGRTPFFAPYRVDAGELLGSAGEGPDGVDAVLLLDQAVERIFPDGSSLYYYHGLTRALTPVGARQAAGLQQLSDAYLLAVRIHKPDGRVVVPADLSGDGIALALSDVEPGDVVEEEYVARVAPTGTSRRGHLPPYVYRFADDERAFGRSEYLLLVPPGIDLQVDGNLEGLERVEDRRDGLRVLGWRAVDVPPVPSEPLAPPGQQLLPWVTYGFGVTWQDVGDAVRDRVLPLLRSSPELAAWARRHADPASGPRAEVAALVRALVEDVERGRVQLDLGRSAASSFEARRGNRLLIAATALLGRGFEVDLVLARPRPYAGTHLEVPSMEPFSRPLLRIGRDGERLWLDLEQGLPGVGRIAPILQGSDGLVLPLADPTRPVRLLAELPAFDNPELEEVVRVAARVGNGGAAAIGFETVVYGDQAERMLDSVRSVPTERAGLVFQRLAGNLFPGAEQVRGGLDPVDGGARLELDLELRDACEPTAASLTCRSLVLSRPLAPLLASLPTRRHPLVLALPLMQRIELEIDAPAGWTVDRPPRRLEASWGSVRETLEVDGGRVRSVLEIRLPAQTVAPERYPEFARFCRAVDELASRPPILVPR